MAARAALPSCQRGDQSTNALGSLAPVTIVASPAAKRAALQSTVVSRAISFRRSAAPTQSRRDPLWPNILCLTTDRLSA